jgi:hypothetical protein
MVSYGVVLTHARRWIDDGFPPAKDKRAFYSNWSGRTMESFLPFCTPQLGSSSLVSMTSALLFFPSFFLSLFVLFYLSSREIPWTRLIPSW